MVLSTTGNQENLILFLTVLLSREGNTPDWALDLWHPWEKVQLMDFFDKREELKKDFHQYYEDSLAKKYQEPAKA